jgi:hypothetical protein
MQTFFFVLKILLTNETHRMFTKEYDNVFKAYISELIWIQVK